jgi:hypothetical protein
VKTVRAEEIIERYFAVFIMQIGMKKTGKAERFQSANMVKHFENKKNGILTAFKSSKNS